jgi:WD40 repeat protein
MNVGCDNGKLYLWDVASSQLLCILQGHQGAVHSVAFSEEDNSNKPLGSSDAILSGGADCSVRVWNIAGLMQDFDAGRIRKDTQSVMGSRHAYFTKYCPVQCVGYTAQNLGFAGGSFCASVSTCEL